MSVHCKRVGPYRLHGSRWHAGCATCGVKFEPTFKTKKEALAFFKRHSWDDEETWPKVMQDTILNLKAVGLLE